VARAYIAIGSNIAPETNIPKALEALSERCRIEGISRFYRSRPLNRPEQADFINGACVIETGLSPRELKYRILREIEKSLDRVRTSDRYAARTIDIDIALYENEVIYEEDLVIPDPDIVERPFLYLPLLDLDADLRVPGMEMALREVVDVERNEGVIVDMTFTDALQECWVKK
jgi:2-amino-4-hydroxy-6-hydroxymethyldihydropteridine diphosphokinase